MSNRHVRRERKKQLHRSFAYTGERYVALYQVAHDPTVSPVKAPVVRCWYVYDQAERQTVSAAYFDQTLAEKHARRLNEHDQ